MSKILVIVEGPDEKLALGRGTHNLLSLVDPNKYFEVIPFCNPIYELYEGYKNGNYDDIVRYLRIEKGLNIGNNILSKTAFSSIYLIFDYEPNYQKYSDDIIKDILNTFNDETENGKLYINYPMFEAFYHIKSLPDKEYIDRKVNIINANSTEYKILVNQEMCLRKNKITHRGLRYIIQLNYYKAINIMNTKSDIIDYLNILNRQIELKNKNSEIYVLATYPLVVLDYNPEILKSILKLNYQ